MKEQLNIKSNVHIKLFDENGKLRDRRDIHNTVTTVGKTHIADQLAASPGETAVTKMAIGTGTPSTTALGSSLDSNTLTSRTHDGAVVTYVGDWAAGDGTGAITEAGLFNTDGTPIMLCSASFSAINKAAADTLQISWTLTIS